MEVVFLNVINMSLTASWMVLAVLCLRFVFKQAPKWMLCGLWGLVALRLICPFSIESALSLIPSAQPLPQEILYTAKPVIESGIPSIDNAINPVLSHSMAPAVGASANPTQIWSFIFSQIWLLGMTVMLLYALVSCLLLKHRMATATILRDNIKQSEWAETPFVLGFLRPTIYLPYNMEDSDIAHVIAHEQAHIRRHDHWWKPLGFLLLSVHWFNPLLWLAYVLLCRDIEAACDETVIREMDQDNRRAYSTALLNCSIHRRRIAACPLAFGEVGVKERVTRVMHYKKPAFWILFAAAAASMAAAVCFLTNPKGVTIHDIAAQNGYTVMEQRQVELSLSIPKSALPDDIYTAQGHEFEENEVIACQTDTTTIYLHKAMMSNESEDLLYFIFKFSYDLPSYGAVIDTYKHADTNTAGYSITLRSKDLRDKDKIYPDSVATRGHGPDRQVAFYVSMDACKAAKEKLIIDVYGNEITYAKKGLEKYVKSDAYTAQTIWENAETSDPADLFEMLCQQNIWNDRIEEMPHVSINGNADVTALFKKVPKDAYTLDVAMARRAVLAMRLKNDHTFCVKWSYPDNSGNEVHRSLYRNRILSILALSSDSRIHIPPSSAEELENLIRYLNLDDKVFSHAIAEDFEVPDIGVKATPLTPEEIEQVNKAFDPYVYDDQGRATGVKSVSCFFTSYYDDVRELNFEAFMRYFPGNGSAASQQEFEALRTVDGWPFSSVASLEQMVVPVHRYPAKMVEQVLTKYAGIELEDLEIKHVAYLAQYDAFYNYTSDAGSGRFVCTRGEKMGNTVRLYEETEEGTDVLTLKMTDGAYRIVSHQHS